jgi:hypothetical protein
MEIAVQSSGGEFILSPKKPWYKNWKWLTAGIIIIIVLVIGGMSYYQATRFNANTAINGMEAGGLTAEEVLTKLQNTVMTNEVYIGDQLIVDGKDTKLGFTKNDLPAIKELLKSQWTFFPTFKIKSYTLMPGQPDLYRSEGLKKELEQQIFAMNQELTPPKDAQAILEQGKIVISKSMDGKQYDVSSLLSDFENQGYASRIHLKPAFLLPVKEDSEIVQNEEKKLQELLLHTVEYKVQDQVFPLKGSELIKNATVSKDLEVSIDPVVLKQKLSQINDTQSTLGKKFNFKTHSGAVIEVKGEGYGWALDIEKETALVKAAFEKGETSVSASNIYGNGWSNEGYGYETTSNYGIGDTYAEVSIKDQRIWLYRDGKMVLTTNVVTGRHSTGENTSPGVWYILFKRTPYTLNGSSAGSGTYSIQVDYWAPFTNSGQGFHDASWRTNWNSNAYLAAGSGGCVNVQPNMMKQVYDNLSVYQPVVVY